MIEGKKIIAVCIARMQDDISRNYVEELNKAISPLGYRLLVYTTCAIVNNESEYADPEFSVYDFIQYDVVDTVIIFEDLILNQAVTDELIRRAKEKEVPVIVMGERHEGCVNVTYDHDNDFEEIIRHMIEIHHVKKFHLIAGMKGNFYSDIREQAFKNTIESYGIPFDDSMVSYGYFCSYFAEVATEKLIASGNLPEAVLCANDRMAMAVCAVFEKHGIKVPEDVAVTGFDGIEEIAYTSPRITSVFCDPMDIAEEIKNVLLQQENLSGQTKTFLVPMKLSIGESCGCKGETSKNVSEYLNLLNDRMYRFKDEELELSKVTNKILRCETLEQVAAQLHHPILYSLGCVIEKNCIDEKVEPSHYSVKKRDADRDMVLLFDSNITEGFVPRNFSLKEISPHLDYALEQGVTIMITALHHMGEPMGYATFCYNEISAGNCLKIAQTANAISSAFGGYRNLRHEQYLSKQIADMYKTDVLTGLYNRRGFEQEYHKLLDGKKEDRRLTVIFADLDGLKYINDHYGHKEGDFAIRAVADALREVCPEGSLVTRFGGDEMLAVCSTPCEPEKIKSQFSQYFIDLNEKVKKEYGINASVGVYVTEENEILEFEELMEKSDKLMYEEKERRKKRRT